VRRRRKKSAEKKKKKERKKKKKRTTRINSVDAVLYVVDQMSMIVTIGKRGAAEEEKHRGILYLQEISILVHSFSIQMILLC